MVAALVYTVVIVLTLWLYYFTNTTLVPPRFRTVASVVLLAIAVLTILLALLNFPFLR